MTGKIKFASYLLNICLNMERIDGVIDCEAVPTDSI